MLLRTMVLSSKTIEGHIFNLVPIIVKNNSKFFPEHVALECNEWTAARTHYLVVLLVFSTSSGNKRSSTGLRPLPEKDDLGAEQCKFLN